jgi:hypothetical protein
VNDDDVEDGVTATHYDPAYLVSPAQRGRAHLLGLVDRDGRDEYTGRTLCGLDGARYRIQRRGQRVCRHCDRVATHLEATSGPAAPSA